MPHPRSTLQLRRLGRACLLLAWLAAFGVDAAVRGRQQQPWVTSTLGKRRLQGGNNMDQGMNVVSTSSPTASPTASPTTKNDNNMNQNQQMRTSEPTASPSRPPTTDRPTRRPTPQPTRRPSTEAPFTAQPTTELTTLRPTHAPSARPSASAAPSTSPPSPAPAAVTLPALTFTASFLPQSTTMNAADMGSRIETFLGDFFGTHAVYRDSFVSLIVTSDTNYDATSGVAVIKSGGSVVFRGREQPDEADIKEILITYFSFWGASDLESALSEAGYSILDLTVAVDGEALPDGGGAAPSAAPVGTGSSSSSAPLGGINPGLIGGVAAAGLLCVISAGIVFRQHLKRRREGPSAGGGAPKTLEVPSDSDGSDSGIPAASTVRKSPNIRSHILRTSRKGPTTAPVSPGDGPADDASGVLSNDESLFISLDGLSPTTSEFSYDAGRLDVVIAKAKAQWVAESAAEDAAAAAAAAEAPPTPKSSNARRS